MPRAFGKIIFGLMLYSTDKLGCVTYAQTIYWRVLVRISVCRRKK